MPVSKKGAKPVGRDQRDKFGQGYVGRRWGTSAKIADGLYSADNTPKGTYAGTGKGFEDEADFSFEEKERRIGLMEILHVTTGLITAPEPEPSCQPDAKPAQSDAEADLWAKL